MGLLARRSLNSLAAALGLLLALAGWQGLKLPLRQAAAPARAGLPGAAAPTAVASTTVLADLLRQVAGPGWQVRSLLPAGADPHAFEPSPADVRDLAVARLVVLVGQGLEPPSVVRLVKAAPSGARVVELARALGGDAHFWTSVPRAMQAVRELERVLKELDPAGADRYARRAAAYLERLRELDRWVRQQLEQLPPGRRLLVSYHPFLQAFADEYGLRLLGSVVGASGSAENVSAAALARLAEQVRRHGVPAIFAEASTPPAQVRQLASATGARVVLLYSDSLGPPGSGADSYEGYVRTNVTRIVEALNHAP